MKKGYFNLSKGKLSLIISDLSANNNQDFEIAVNSIKDKGK